MRSATEKETIKEKLVDIIREILQDEAIEIDPAKSLMMDYGLDSLDLLDFSFNIEELFGVQIGPDELRGRANSKLSKAEIFDENGNISQKALVELKQNIPEIPSEAITYGLRPEDIPTLLNINVFVRMVSEKLADARLK